MAWHGRTSVTCLQFVTRGLAMSGFWQLYHIHTLVGKDETVPPWSEPENVRTLASAKRHRKTTKSLSWQSLQHTVYGSTTKTSTKQGEITNKNTRNKINHRPQLRVDHKSTWWRDCEIRNRGAKRVKQQKNSWTNISFFKWKQTTLCIGVPQSVTVGRRVDLCCSPQRIICTKIEKKKVCILKFMVSDGDNRKRQEWFQAACQTGLSVRVWRIYA